MEAAVLALVVAGAAYSAYAALTTSLDRKHLRIQVADLRSFAAEGKRVSDELAADALPSTFVRTQTELLAAKAADSEKAISSAQPQPETAGAAVRATRIAAEIESLFRRLGAKPRDEGVVSDSGARFARLRDDLSTMENALRD